MENFTLKTDSLHTAIKQAIRGIYPTLPDEFSGNDLIRQVNRQLSMSKFKNRRPYPDTVLRYFRELRQDQELKCKCLNRTISLYKKAL
jgi:hypothetical protein